MYFRIQFERIFYMKEKKLNFEISNAQYKKIKAYAELFCMNKNNLMKLLVCIGIEAYEAEHSINIEKRYIAKEAKEELKELNRQVDGLRISISLASENNRKNLEEKMKYLTEVIIPAVAQRKNALSTRCKIVIPENVDNKLVKILMEQRQKIRSLCMSDIVCSLMRFALEKNYKYLEKYAPYELKIRDRRKEEEKYPTVSIVQYNIEKMVSDKKGQRKKSVMQNVVEEIPEYAPLNEESYWRNNEKTKVTFEVSEMFCVYLKECAENYCISVDDYIKLLIERDFANNMNKNKKNANSLYRG